MFGDISNFNKVSDYLPIFNGVLISELFILILVNVGFFKTIFLKKWYLNFSISAVIMDVFILVIGFIPFHKFRYSLMNICFWLKPSKSFKQIYITMCFMDISILHA